MTDLRGVVARISAAGPERVPDLRQEDGLLRGRLRLGLDAGLAAFLRFIGTTMANVDGAGHEEEVEEGLEH